MFQFWLVRRYLTSGGKFLTWTSTLSLLGLVIGVASLVLTMSVVSGVQSYLQQAIIDVTGHILLLKPSGGINDVDEVLARIKTVLPTTVATTPFVHLEGVLAREGKIAGVMLQGIDPDTSEKVLSLKKRKIAGEFDVSSPDTGLPGAVVGKELQKKFQIQVGDEIQVILPKTATENPTAFAPKSQKFQVKGVVDLGKFDFNERFVMISVAEAQKLAGVGKVFSGVRIRVQDADQARADSFRLSSQFGPPFWTRDWQEVSQNYFSAVQLEKIVIFIVLCFLVLVASFNIATTLYVSVLRRTHDISILKTLGAGERMLVGIFVVQGMLLAGLGTLGGVVLGGVLAFLLTKATWLYIPPEIYKFDRLPVEIRFTDLAAILIVSFLICLLATYGPAKRAARMNPVEGLRYE